MLFSCSVILSRSSEAELASHYQTPVQLARLGCASHPFSQGQKDVPLPLSPPQPVTLPEELLHTWWLAGLGKRPLSNVAV